MVASPPALLRLEAFCSILGLIGCLPSCPVVVGLEGLAGLLERGIKETVLTDTLFIKCKSDLIKSDLIKSDLIKSDLIKSDLIKLNLIKSQLLMIKKIKKIKSLKS